METGSFGGRANSIALCTVGLLLVLVAVPVAWVAQIQLAVQDGASRLDAGGLASAAAAVAPAFVAPVFAAPVCGVCPQLDDPILCRGAVSAAIASAAASSSTTFPSAAPPVPSAAACPSQDPNELCRAAVAGAVASVLAEAEAAARATAASAVAASAAAAAAAEKAAVTVAAAVAAAPSACPTLPLCPVVPTPAVAAPFAGALRAAAGGANEPTAGGAATRTSDSTTPWGRRVAFRSWDGTEPFSPLLCRNAQSGVLPRSANIFDRCTADPAYGNVDAPGWPSLLPKLLGVSCAYSSGSPTERRYAWNEPSPSASVFIAFVQAQPIDESAATRRTRQALTRWTLTRLRAQFGDALELTVVELFDVALDEERDFGAGVVNSAVSHLNFEGQDWAMYQLAINSVMHRIAQFKWVIVMNDQMVGPFAPLPAVLAAESADMYVTSSLPGCCIRGFRPWRRRRRPRALPS